MKKIEITSQEAKQLCFEDDCGDYKHVETSSFTDDGKWQHAECVFLYKDKHYIFYVARSGSPYTEYYYDIEDAKTVECFRVEKVTVTETVWAQT